jgi:hypothetical protein
MALLRIGVYLKDFAMVLPVLMAYLIAIAVLRRGRRGRSERAEKTGGG